MGMGFAFLPTLNIFTGAQQRVSRAFLFYFLLLSHFLLGTRTRHLLRHCPFQISSFLTYRPRSVHVAPAQVANATGNRHDYYGDGVL